MHCLLPLFHILVLYCFIVFGFRADIRADSNRDGKVDLVGNTDLTHKLSTSNNAGAIFLANIGDTDRRCSKSALQGRPPSNEELAACNDASNDLQRSPRFMAPLRTVPIPSLSRKAYGTKAYGTIAITNAEARKNVRIFRREGFQWLITPAGYRFPPSQPGKGLELGIDGRNTRRPGEWDGRVTIQCTVHDKGKTSVDSVKLRVAPILTHHHSESVRQIITTAGNNTGNFFQGRFVSALEGALAKMDIKIPLFQFNASDDIWAQDFFEPGYTGMPGPDGPIALQIMICSAQDGRIAGRQVFEYLRGPETGAVQHPGGARDEINSMGNLETIPPYIFNGREYPAGRIILGTHGLKKPHILEFLLAQEVQDPLLLDTDWLAIGHVDEFIQFLPSNNSLGWVMLFPDPQEGLNLLRRAQSAGHGSVRAFSRQNDTEGNPHDLFGVPGGLRGVPSYTINDLLSQNHTVEANARFSKRIKTNIDLLKRETGIKDTDIYAVPAVFRTSLTYPPNVGVDPKRNGSSELAASLYPSTINGLVLSDTQYLAPNPWGPVIGGVDIMADAALKVYGRLGFNVGFVDNWNSHHTWGGEVHCATNTVWDRSYWW
ncbi:hypothetical protein PAAG_02835 [Paracoccidioides lutzii Pb01]|uniref:Protein-arginine deiminase C-terminal domain-containing protein n=1 Tax=Paracoccidioides lutzii (strain ATCC MYA-826 / Pb01) TaxID=502779 RepID=C1GWE0_PARBA|nr:hypothetical protein PAAG_02835 [Paracoccidioides lutzii Pb01]EEH40859.2 hypothetical protein PAAG_02835 [Paracoccidioides lutzii Pb01]